jgi:hypothetical protein
MSKATNSAIVFPAEPLLELESLDAGNGREKIRKRVENTQNARNTSMALPQIRGPSAAMGPPLQSLPSQ